MRPGIKCCKAVLLLRQEFFAVKIMGLRIDGEANILPNHATCQRGAAARTENTSPQQEIPPRQERPRAPKILRAPDGRNLGGCAPPPCTARLTRQHPRWPCRQR